MRPLALLLLASCATGTAVDPIDAGSIVANTIDAGSTDAGPASDVVDASRYCDETAPFFCRFYLRCGRLAAANETECRRVFAESCAAKYLPRYAGLADAGLLELSRSGLDACAAHLDDVACDAQVQDLDGPCAGMWRGLSMSGAACGFDVDSFVCAPGLRCQLNATFCGRCVPEMATGELCDADHACGVDNSCVESKCVQRARPGATCADSRECVIGTSCVSGVCAGPTRSEEGAACGQGSRCPYRTACLGGVCRRQGLLGETCGEAGCASGFCEEGRCVVLLKSDAACTKGAQCESGLCVAEKCERVPGHCFE